MSTEIFFFFLCPIERQMPQNGQLFDWADAFRLANS